MKKKFYIVGLLVLPIILCNLNCSGPQAPTSPGSSAPTNTPTNTSTPTTTPTGTLSPSPTPPCMVAIDITSYINGADYNGNDTGKTTPAALNLDQGGTTTGDILSFTLSAAATLNFSLCPTEQIGRMMMMYIRSACTSSTGEAFNGGYCSGMAQITGLYLQAGTYYIILPEAAGSNGPGSYILRILSGNLSSTVCSPSNGVVPETIPAGQFDSCSNYYELNGTSLNGTYGAPFSGTRAATGELDESDTVANSDDFVSFIPTNSGAVTVTLECFDNGMGSNDFDVYAASSCPTDGSTPAYVGYANAVTATQQFSFTGTGGTTYYLDLQAYQGTGPYRLTITTP